MALVAGCSTSQALRLTRDPAGNREKLLAIVPIGTRARDASARFRNYGFTWDLHRDEVVHINKSPTEIGTTPPMTFAICKKSVEGTACTITVLLDSAEHVSDVSVSSEAIKE